MRLTINEPVRTFVTGRGEPITIRDCAAVRLEPDEQVTFTTESAAEYDVVRKSWGFYATPSINGRLLNFGLRTALVKSYIGKYYIFLIERGKEDEAARYLRKEDNAIVRWLDNDGDLKDAESPAAAQPTRPMTELSCPCGVNRLTTVHTYFAPPDGETRLPSGSTSSYRRELFRCSICGHFLSVDQMPKGALYVGEYVNATYGDEAGLREAFARIVALPMERSDNAGRVRRIVRHFEQDRPSDRRLSVLDVGAGLCVFLHAMQRAGWDCTALDPDARAVRHAKEVVGVNAVCADFMTWRSPDQFDLITFNKVLEHVVDPTSMLATSITALRETGVVYVELPDGELASTEGFSREEFFIEHFHVFSATSLGLLATKAGFDVLSIERLREPSSKYTLRAFLTPRRRSRATAQ